MNAAPSWLELGLVISTALSTQYTPIISLSQTGRERRLTNVTLLWLCVCVLNWNMNAGDFIACSESQLSSSSRCPTWRPWLSSGCTVPAPWDAAPESFYSRRPSWFWHACSETRFWSETRWDRGPGPGSASVVRSGSGCSGTLFLTAGAAPRWRPSGAVCPLYSGSALSLVCEIWALKWSGSETNDREWLESVLWTFHTSYSYTSAVLTKWNGFSYEWKTSLFTFAPN